MLQENQNPMDNENKVSPEELEAEKVASQLPKEEDVRSNIITDFDFDEVKDKERIDKLVAKEMESRKKLFEAIGQKIKHRTTADELRNKIPKVEDKTSSQTNMTPKDIIALTKADVHEDDMQEVIDYAKFKNISIADALKSDIVKTTLADAVEKRKSAEVATSRTTRQSTTKATDDDLVKDLSNGKIPEKGSDEASQLFWARRKKK